MRTTLIVSLLLLAGCSTNMWIPVQTSPRASVPASHVQFLEAPPDRPFEVIGIITPPVDEYETEAEAVRAILKEAARHGADAIFIESQKEHEGWGFSAGMFGASGGSGMSTAYRAKAIIWK
jgi:hypothetical protein